MAVSPYPLHGGQVAQHPCRVSDLGLREGAAPPVALAEGVGDGSSSATATSER
jgi:hypothetical protein